MNKCKRLISTILMITMIMTNILMSGNQLTVYGAQYEVKHDFPEAIASLEVLDTSINVTETGGTNQFPKEASWKIDGKGTFNDAGSIVKTIMTLTENKQQFSYEFVAIPKDVVYLVDCAVTESEDFNRYRNHAAEDSLAALINDVPDQAYEEGSWGYTSVMDTDMGIKAWNTSLAGTKHQTGYWAKEGKVISYKLPLEAGKYSITAALYEWWDQTRDVGMNISYTDEAGESQSKVLGSKTISKDNKQDYISGIFELAADQTIEVTFLKNSGSQEAVLSGFTVGKTTADIPEEGVISFDLDGNVVDHASHYGGFGLVTCNNTSRLLMDYKELNPDAYWEIMNLLFDKETGAGLTHIKIEMGADTNSSSGSEPSTMRSPDEEANVRRGAGFVFAADAKTINENIKVELLRWAEPKWTQEGLGYGGDRYEARYQWYRETIDAVYHTYGYKINEISPGQNERRNQMDDNFAFTKYVAKRLREDAENGIGAYDYREIKVVAGDLYRDIGTTVDYLMNDEELRSLVSVIGDHYQITNANKDLQTLIDDYGMTVGYTEATAPMITASDRYNVEQSTGGIGGRYGIVSHAERYIAAYAYKSSSGYSNRMTYMLFQPAVAAFYEGSAYNPKQLIMATNPWTGYYSVDGGIQMVQHFNHFIEEDWVYLADACYADGTHDDGAVKFDTATDTRLALKDPQTDDYTVVFANNTNKPRSYSITLKNLATKTASYNIWESNGPGAGEAFDANWMQKTGAGLQPEILDNGDGNIKLTVRPNSMVTLTSDLSRGKEYQAGQNDSGRENGILELPYRDDFNYADDFAQRRGGTPLFTTDQHGAFEVEPCEDGGYSLVHQIDNENRPYTWNVWGSGGDEKGQTTSVSWTALGDHRWSNYTAGADIKFDTESNGYGDNFSAIGVRELTHGSGAAYRARLYADGKWELLKYNTVVEKGSLPLFDHELWHRLELRADEDVITIIVDNEELAAITDSTVMSGRITLMSGFYKTKFDNLQVMPIEGKAAYSLAKLDDTSEALSWSGNVSHALVEGYGHYNRSRTTLQSGGSVAFTTFPGTGFDIFGNTGGANITVTVDGGSQVVTTPARSDRETSYWTHSLDDSQEHEVEVTVNSGSYVIDGINLFSGKYESDGTLFTAELERLIGYAGEVAKSDKVTEEVQAQIIQVMEEANALIDTAGTQTQIDYMVLRLKNACIKLLSAGAAGEIGLEENSANFELGTQSVITSYPMGGEILEITSGWNQDRLKGVARFINGKNLFGKPAFTYSAFVYSLADHERSAAFAAGNADRYFSINPSPLALRYKGSGADEITVLSDVREMINDEWIRLTVSYEESEASGFVTVYIDGEEVISARELGFKLSELDAVDGYIGGTFFATSYMGRGKYDNIVVTNEAFDGDISRDAEKAAAIAAELEAGIEQFGEKLKAVDFSEKSAAEEYMEQLLAAEFADLLADGTTIRPHITAFEPAGERFRESFAGQPGSMTFSLKAATGNAKAFTRESTCEFEFDGELGEIPVYDSFSGVAQGAGDKEQSLWLDTDGVHIQAHGGQVQKLPLAEAGMWVWYGEDKTRNGNPIDGVNCYLSTDLYNWENKGTVLFTHDIFPARLGNDGDFADNGICLDEAAYEKLKKWAEMDEPAGGISRKEIDMAKNFTAAYIDSSSATGYDEESMKLAFWYMYTGYGIVERPKMLYHEVTGNYIIIYHQDGPDGSNIKACIENGSYNCTGSRYSRASMGFAVSDNPFGPFKLVNVQWMNGYPEQFSAKPGMARDMNVFIDDTDVDQNGVPDAYAIYSSEENAKMYISLLNDEYTGPAAEGAADQMLLEDGTTVQTFATRVLPDNARESPAVFKFNGFYYMFTSGTTGWNPNPGVYYRAEHIYGPWTQMGDFCEGGSSNTFRSQNTSVIPYDPAAGLFIYMGDRWRTENDSSALWYSSHVWLPIQITSDNKLEVKKVSDWNLDMLEQYASVIVNSELPEYVVYGQADTLPETVNVTVGGSTFDSAVTWEEPKALGMQTIKGTLAQTGGVISFEAVAVIEEAVYFVDCGAEGIEGRDYFNLISELSEDTMQNLETPDRAYLAGAWGYEGDNTKARSGDLDLYELLRYVNGGTGRDLVYSFDEIEKGEYSVYLGFFNPTSWPSTVRAADISLEINGETADTAVHNITDGVKDMVAFDHIGVTGDSKLRVTVSPKNSGSNTDVQISYIAIVKTAEEVYEQDIIIRSKPAKLSYYIGEELDPAGMVIELSYSDGSTRTLNSGDYWIGDYDFSAAGKVEITVHYSEGEKEMEASFFVTVYDLEELGDNRIAIVKEPDRKIYSLGEDFDTSGMEVRLLRCATASNASPKEVVSLDDSDYELEYDFESAGRKTVTIIYCGTDSLGGEKVLQTETRVTVIDDTFAYDPVKLKITNKPYRSVYAVDEELDLTGMKVTLTSAVASPSDASLAYSEEITDYEVEGFDSSETGLQKITVFVEAVDEAGDTYLLADSFRIWVVKNAQQVVEDKVAAIIKEQKNQFKDIDPDFILLEERQDGLAEGYDKVKDILETEDMFGITGKTAAYLNELEEAVLAVFPQITVTIDGEKEITAGLKIYGTIWRADIDLSDGSQQDIVITVNETKLSDRDFEFGAGSKITGIGFAVKINGQEQELTGPVWISMDIPKEHDQSSEVYCFAEGNDGFKLTPAYNNNQLGIWIRLPAVIGFVTESPITEVKLKSISITKQPVKMEYYIGEAFESDGMEITAFYSDGTTAVVSGYQVETVTFTSYGSHKVKVTFEGHFAYLEVDVIRRSGGLGGSGGSGSEEPKTNSATKLGASLIGISGTVDGEWRKDGTGWWYALASGGYAKNQWAQIGGVWYLFDPDGYLYTGWRQLGETWYFLHESGAMAASQWIESDGKWYYLNADGSMAVNQITADGYLVGADGSWR